MPALRYKIGPLPWLCAFLACLPVHSLDGKAAEAVQTALDQTIHGSLAGNAQASADSFQTPAVGAIKPAGKETSKVIENTPDTRGKAPCMTWINSDKPVKAVLLCVHGLGLHNASYANFGKAMADLGVPTYAVDVRGFGSWTKNPQHNRVDFTWCLQDIHDTLKVLHRVHPHVPVFLLGESMGGAIALRAAAMYPDLVDGLISCVPSGDRFKQGRTEIKVAWKLLHAPNTPFDIGKSVVKQASESATEKGGINTSLEQHWLDDRLNRRELSPRELLQFQHFMNENHIWAAKLTDKPVLMVQGGDDALVKATGTLELLSEIPATNPQDVDLVVIRKAKHLIFEESEYNDQAFNARVIRLVNGWIDDHLSGSPAQMGGSDATGKGNPALTVKPASH